MMKSAVQWMGLAVCLAALVAGASAQDDGRRWKSLGEDGVHDPANADLKQLQAPANALSKLPASKSGNIVDWVQALTKGLIKPRSAIDSKKDAEANVYDGEIVLNVNGSMRPVRFRHLVHTQLLDCTNCHEDIFKMEEGASGISKLRIQNGEQCGVCHASVAFPLTDCRACHNQPWDAKPASAAKR